MKKQILIEKYIEPSEVIININSVIENWIDRNYDLHSSMGQPSEIYYFKGKVSYQAWHKKGIYHREIIHFFNK
jgi:hypothetical protein